MNATAPRQTAKYRQRMHNSLMALSAVAVAALLAVLAARPLPVEDGAVVLEAEAPAAIDTPLEDLLDSAAPAADADALPQAQPKRSHVRRSRQILAMPYFSFAARS
jgi:hypothetical protein